MRLMLVATLLAVPLLACQGPAGHDGAPGRDGTFTRTPSYCNTWSTFANAGDSWSTAVSCNNALDIPLSGDCFEPQGLPTGAVLSAADPVNWDTTTEIAGWKCQWAWQDGATQVDFAIKAEICCATP
jgi:hypothetical protein